MSDRHAITRVARDLERIRGLVEDTGAAARESLELSQDDPEGARRAITRLMQFEDIALQLVQQARSHLDELEGGAASKRVVEQDSLDPGDIEIF